MVVEGTNTESPSCASYSEDEFELSLSPVSSVFHAVGGGDLGDEVSDTSDNEEYDTESGEERDSSTAVQGQKSVGAIASNSECSYSSLGSPADEDSDPRAEVRRFSGQSSWRKDIEENPRTAKEDDSRPRAEEEVSFSGQSSWRESIEENDRTAKQDDSRSRAEEEGSFSGQSSRREGIEENPRTAKQKYLDLRRKVATVCEEAHALAQRRNAEEMQVRLNAQQTKESWHSRIHRRRTEAEWHKTLAAKTAASIVETTLNREAWAKGLSCARVKGCAIEEDFASAFGSFRARTSEGEETSAATERKKEAQGAEACSSVWEAARLGVPVRRLRELLTAKIDQSRYVNPSSPFEQLCRRAKGIVVESRHPYPKGIRQDVEAYVPGAEGFFIAFDAASNATAGAGQVSLQGHNVKDPAVFSVRGPYCNELDGSTRLPGVNGEPPLRVEGSSVLVTFSASYWHGVAPAGENYGWRLVCFTANGGTIEDAKALLEEAERAADRAQAVDAANVMGETCLHVACFEGNLSAVRYLLSLDADPNSAHTAGGGNTPLHEAVRGGLLAAVQLLLKSSANVLAADLHGDLPLHVACRAGRVDIARRLIAHDSDWSTVAERNHAGLRPSDIVHGCAALASLMRQVEGAAGGLRSGQRIGGRGAPGRRPELRHKRGVDGSSTGIGGCSRSRGGGKGPGAKGVGVSSGSVLPRWARLPRPLEGGGVVLEETALVSRSGSGTSYGASLAESDFVIPKTEPAVSAAAAAAAKG